MMRHVVAAVGVVLLLGVGALVVRHTTPQSSPVSPGLSSSGSPTSATSPPDPLDIISNLLATSSALAAPSSAPPIAWSPSSLDVTMGPGETKTLAVTATLRSAIPANVARLVPALSPHATALPPSLPQLSKGATQTFLLTFTIPDGTPFQTVTGTLHLDSGTTTLAQPLPIVLNVWPEQVLADGVLALKYPPSFTPEPFPATSGDTYISYEASDGRGFSIEAVDTPGDSSDLQAWADISSWPFSDSWRNHLQVIPLDGTEALRDPVAQQVIFKIGDVVYFVVNGLGREDRLLLDSSTFGSIIDSIRVVP